MIVSVLQSDIEEGEPRNSWRCPIALAIRRATGSHTVQVFGRQAMIDGQPHALNDECDNFVQVFDVPHSRGRCCPFNFEL